MYQSHRYCSENNSCNDEEKKTCITAGFIMAAMIAWYLTIIIIVHSTMRIELYVSALVFISLPLLVFEIYQTVKRYHDTRSYEEIMERRGFINYHIEINPLMEPISDKPKNVRFYFQTFCFLILFSTMILLVIFCSIYWHRFIIYDFDPYKIKTVREFELNQKHYVFDFVENFTIGSEIEFHDKFMMTKLFIGDIHIGHGYLYHGSNTFENKTVGYFLQEFVGMEMSLRKATGDNKPILFFGEYPDTSVFIILMLFNIFVSIFYFFRLLWTISK